MKRLAIALSVLAVLSACTPAEPEAFDFAVAGDSLTAWDNQSFPHPTGEFNAVTWTHWAMGEEGTLVGGYAREDATADEIASKIIPVEADLLVVMAGTNDGVHPSVESAEVVGAAILEAMRESVAASQ